MLLQAVLHRRNVLIMEIHLLLATILFSPSRSDRMITMRLNPMVPVVTATQAAIIISLPSKLTVRHPRPTVEAH